MAKSLKTEEMKFKCPIDFFLNYLRLSNRTVHFTPRNMVDLMRQVRRRHK